MEQKKWVVIKCPHCGWEYAPAEIFMPGDLIGKPDSVVRDALGKVLYIDYPEDEQPLTSEQFVCENCGKPFVVEPTVGYKVKKETEELDFTEDTVSLI